MSNPASIINTAGYRGLLKLINEQSGDTTSVTVLNATGGTLSAGTVVYVSSISSGIPSVAKARANAAGTMPAVGILTTSIANNQLGTAKFVGELSNVDTSAFSAGAKLYISAATAGALTSTQPAHPNLSQLVAIVLTASTNGTLFILPGIDLHGIDLGTNQNTFNIGDGAAGAKTLAFVNTNVGQLQWTPGAARTLTLPDATDTLVGRATTDTLTNKTYQGVSVAVSSRFGCNGASPQTRYSLGALSTDTTIAAIQTALINCGIGST
jgi:hypothetical protein